MRPPVVTEHLRLEIAAVRWRGWPLEPNQRVPGCVCGWCLADPRPPTLAELKAGVIARALADNRITPADLDALAEPIDVWATARAAELLPSTADRESPRPRPRWRGARRLDGSIIVRDPFPPLDIDAARAIPIIEVAARLGIEHRRGWARCLFHFDHDPSLHLNTKKDAAFCNPCGKSWDGIALVMELRGLNFPAAVRWLLNEPEPARTA
ncbi:MAG: CHC2 zinc finger domain-containing protein [Longimicrobiales bacterium]